MWEGSKGKQFCNRWGWCDESAIILKSEKMNYVAVIEISAEDPTSNLNGNILIQ